MPTGLVNHVTEARSAVSDADLEGPETYGAGDLVVGENVLAVEVHQSGANSTDVVFGLALEAVRLVTNVVQLTVPVVINELRARSSEGQPDWVELFNPGAGSIDLSGCSLTDDVTVPRKYVIPEGRTIPAGEFRVWNAGGSPTPGLDDLGFAFAAEGGGVFLFARPEQGGGLLDGVRYGNQPAAHALGRVPDGTAHWTLTMPSPGSANCRPHSVRRRPCGSTSGWPIPSRRRLVRALQPGIASRRPGRVLPHRRPRRSPAFAGAGPDLRGRRRRRVLAGDRGRFGSRPGRAAFRLGRGGDTVALVAPEASSSSSDSAPRRAGFPKDGFRTARRRRSPSRGPPRRGILRITGQSPVWW